MVQNSEDSEGINGLPKLVVRCGRNPSQTCAVLLAELPRDTIPLAPSSPLPLAMYRPTGMKTSKMSRLCLLFFFHSVLIPLNVSRNQ
jgi:hypothetical protein